MAAFLPLLLSAGPSLLQAGAQLFGGRRRRGQEQKAMDGMSRLSDVFSNQLQGGYFNTPEASGAMTEITRNQQAQQRMMNAGAATQGLTDEARLAMSANNNNATANAFANLGRSANIWRQQMLGQKQNVLQNMWQMGNVNRQMFNQSLSNIFNPMQGAIDTGFNVGAFDGMLNKKPKARV